MHIGGFGWYVEGVGGGDKVVNGMRSASSMSKQDVLQESNMGFLSKMP